MEQRSFARLDCAAKLYDQRTAQSHRIRSRQWPVGASPRPRLSFSGAPADVLSEAVRRLAIGLRRSLSA